MKITSIIVKRVIKTMTTVIFKLNTTWKKKVAPIIVKIVIKMIVKNLSKIMR